MKKEFDALSDYVKNYTKGKSIYYVSNPGNWGDALIRQGTLKFFREHKIQFKEIRLTKTDWIKPSIRGGVVIFGGGGGWCKNWNRVAKNVQLMSKRFKVLVLPSTYELSYDIPSTFFFRRDNYESKESMPNSQFCHDMAFYLGNVNFKEGNGIGNFFRTDKESRDVFAIPDDNYDISTEGDHFSEGISLFKEVAKYSIIHTDRLHISIAACLLNREVHLYPGSYFKNEAVYKSSLLPNFDNVEFHGQV